MKKLPPRPSTEPLQRERESERRFIDRAPFIRLSKSPVDKPSSRFPRRAPMERGARLQSLFYISFRVPGKGALPPGSPKRAPIERDAPFPDPLFLFLHLSRFCPAAPPGTSEREPFSESRTAELSFCSKFETVLFIQVPRIRGYYKVHQVEPPYLVRLITSGSSPGITKGAVWDILTHCHSSHRHGTHTVGLGIVFKVYLFWSAVFCVTGSSLVGYGSSPYTNGLRCSNTAFRNYHPWRMTEALNRRRQCHLSVTWRPRYEPANSPWPLICGSLYCVILSALFTSHSICAVSTFLLYLSLCLSLEVTDPHCI